MDSLSFTDLVDGTLDFLAFLSVCVVALLVDGDGLLCFVNAAEVLSLSADRGLLPMVCWTNVLDEDPDVCKGTSDTVVLSATELAPEIDLYCWLLGDAGTEMLFLSRHLNSLEALAPVSSLVSSRVWDFWLAPLSLFRDIGCCTTSQNIWSMRALAVSLATRVLIHDRPLGLVELPAALILSYLSGAPRHISAGSA